LLSPSGIGWLSIHLPLQWRKKSSPGLTLGSAASMPRPQRPVMIGGKLSSSGLVEISKLSGCLIVFSFDAGSKRPVLWRNGHRVRRSEIVYRTDYCVGNQWRYHPDRVNKESRCGLEKARN